MIPFEVKYMQLSMYPTLKMTSNLIQIRIPVNIKNPGQIVKFFYNVAREVGGTDRRLFGALLPHDSKFILYNRARKMKMVFTSNLVIPEINHNT